MLTLVRRLEYCNNRDDERVYVLLFAFVDMLTIHWDIVHKDKRRLIRALRASHVSQRIVISMLLHAFFVLFLIVISSSVSEGRHPVMSCVGHIFVTVVNSGILCYHRTCNFVKLMHVSGEN